jgi:hypothetical protein
MKKMFVALLILGAIYTLYYFIFRDKYEQEPDFVVSNFEECMLAGFPIMESYPRQCASPSGTFVENIGNEIDKTNE